MRWILDETASMTPMTLMTACFGLKGTMSEAELRFLRARLQEGYLTRQSAGSWHLPCPWLLSMTNKNGFAWILMCRCVRP